MGINYALLLNRQWNKKQKHKKQPWGNVECFAFGGGIVRLAALETSFHAANHTILPPPSHEGYPWGDATALAGEGGVGDVVWLIQASA